MPAKTDDTKKKPTKDPKGGLTAAGRAHFKATEGANLKPGVKGPADTTEKQKRKGSFLRRHFANADAGPLKDAKGEPTRHALSAQAWGEPVPTTQADIKKLAAKGSTLLDQSKEGAAASTKPVKKPAPSATKPKVKTTKVAKSPKSKNG